MADAKVEAPFAPEANLQSEIGDQDVQLTITYHGDPITFGFPPDGTIEDLSTAVAENLLVPASNQKFMITPKVGVLRPPFKDPSLSLSSLSSKKIVLMGSTSAEVASVETLVAESRSRPIRRSGRVGGATGPIQPAAPARRRDWKREQEEAIYTFTTLRPLPYLPRPERSERFLARLRDDPGIKATMRKHKWTVPLLTEMDPAAHTTHESRTLGLNRNRGEVIELRLRTDAYDGYRDYRTIRNTLCHELAHNVWGEHDRNFWELCKQIEREVESGDWRSGGHALSDQEFYNPDDDQLDATDQVADHGGWSGGEFVLGAGSAAATQQPSGAGAQNTNPLSRREILARAAEERFKQQQQHGKPGNEAGS
ncbi:WLM-domain-containing protein [Xylona heveae TC161]|uniref:WLM-domain-containing protein n=1 Tax=Xylona heveae (strain CBS 132557 / TC161) TaxID=1328760 RepID=A0A165AKN8_XYLHT|nr:WLM-domain-containing protein [Xylona heveae TC161]KZF20643.1 WLM-domain-containing protein [Xylona heveae TC161]